jgi:hypothetical protein
MPQHGRSGRTLAFVPLALAFSAFACRDAVVPGGDWIAADGKPVYATEGGIVRERGQWYLWGLDRSRNNSTFEAVNLYRSPDLVHWTFVKQILKHSSNALIDNNATVERAKLLRNPKTGKWVMWMHYEGHNAYSVAEVAYATADSIDGDFVFQDHFRPMNLDSRDLNVYQDDDGSAYLLCTTLGNQDVSLFSLDSTYTKVVKEVYRGSASNNFQCEGHSIVKSGGRYFWIMSLCSGWDFNDNHYFYASNLAGPWTSGGNIAPSGAKTFESQVGWALPMPGNNGTDFVFMGDRWSVPNFSMSRMVMLPMKVSGTALSLSWQDRWYPGDTGWTAGAPYLPDGVYEIKVRGSGKVLQPKDGATGSAHVVQMADAGSDAQKWRIENQGGASFRITNVGSGLRLDVNGGSRDTGANLLQYADNGNPNQRWHILASDSAWWRLVNLNTLEKAAQVAGASTADGAEIVLGNFAYGKHQEFELVPVDSVVSGASYELVARHSGKAATIRSDGSLVQSTDAGSAGQIFQFVARERGTWSIVQGGKALRLADDAIGEGAVPLLGADTGRAARWTVSDAGGGWWAISNGCSGRNLDVDGGPSATGEGVKILAYRYWASTNQQWKLKKTTPSVIATRSYSAVRIFRSPQGLVLQTPYGISDLELTDLGGRRHWRSESMDPGTRQIPMAETGVYILSWKESGHPRRTLIPGSLRGAP